MQDLVRAMSDIGHQTRADYHLTLGELIERLKGYPLSNIVAIDSGGYPYNDHSYRGYYSDLAFESGEEPKTVAEFLCICKRALNSTYEGYKGGDFVMDKDTPLWVSASGVNSNMAIMDIVERGDEIVLITKVVK